MKVICDRAAILDAITVVSGVVAARTPKPQLTCVKIDAEKTGKAGRLTLSATDAEVSISIRIDRVEVEKPGAALVPADKLAQIVRAEEHDPTLAIEADGDTTHIRGADAHFQLRGFPPADFPDIPGAPAPADVAFTEDARTVSELVRRTLFAAARENSRYAINGVLLSKSGDKLQFVATDGRRLALARSRLDAKGGSDVSCIIPSKALNILSRLIDDPQEPIAVAVSDNQAVFAFGAADGEEPRAILASSLVEGTFPPYEDVIPKDHDITVTFEKDTLASAVKRAALLTNEESRGVRMAFNAADKRLELSSRVPEMGEARIGVDLAAFNGDDIEIGFNPAFITDALRVIDDTRIVVELKGPTKPGLLKAGNDFVYVVMPVTLQ